MEDFRENQVQTQSQIKQDDWPKKTQKNAPYKWFYPSQVYHSFSGACPWDYLHVIIFLLPSTLLVSLLSICLCKFIYTKSEVQGLVTYYWSSRPSTWDSELSHASVWLQSLSKEPVILLQAAGWGSLRSKGSLFYTMNNLYILQHQLLKITTLELVKMSFLTIKTLYILMKILLIFSLSNFLLYFYSNSNK